MLLRDDLQGLEVLGRGEPVYWQGRYWTEQDFKAFQRALQRSQRQWTEADRALLERRLDTIAIRWNEEQ